MKFNLFILFVFILLFSGCGNDIQNCSEQNTKYVKYSWDEDVGQCMVSNEIEKDVCGNGIIEEGETFCSCPRDATNEKATIENGGCSGNKGDFLEYQCNDDTKQCELMITDKVKKNSKLLTLKSGSDFAIDAQVDYYVPFMKDRHEVEVEFMLKDLADSSSIKVKDLIIRKAYLVTQSNELIGEINVDKTFKDVFDSFTINIAPDSFTMDTFNVEKKNTYLKILVSYTKETYSGGNLLKSETVNKEIKQLFEYKFLIIDPQNKGEELGDSSGGWG